MVAHRSSTASTSGGRRRDDWRRSLTGSLFVRGGVVELMALPGFKNSPIENRGDLMLSAATELIERLEVGRPDRMGWPSFG